VANSTVNYLLGSLFILSKPFVTSGAGLELDQSGFLKQTYTETDFLDGIQTKVLKFSPCYSESPLQLCVEISISSNSRNLLQFL
jgi:hypothetical protein